MGRNRKPAINLQDSTDDKEFSIHTDELPTFTSFFDAKYDKDIGESHAYPIRVFLKIATENEIENTIRLYEQSGGKLVTINVDMPYNRIKNTSTPLYDYTIGLGFNKVFSEDVCRLVLKKYNNSNKSKMTISCSLIGIKNFIQYLSTQVRNKNSFILNDISLGHWLGYSDLMASDSRKSSTTIFLNTRKLFKDHKKTSLNGRLSHIGCKKKIEHIPAIEHTSEFFSDNSYSDSELYQMIALFLSFISRHTEARIHYEELSAKNMPGDWLSPEKIKSIKASSNKKIGELSRLVENLFSKNNNHTIIDHFLLWDKISNKNFMEQLNSICSKKILDKLIIPFNINTRNSIGIKKDAPYSFIDFYRNQERNAFRRQHGYCLANLLMLYTGENKGTVLSIPSCDKNGASILNRNQSLFITKENNDSECELYGYKTRNGSNKLERKLIQIPKNAPIYLLLKNYEKFVKKDFNGPFFEFTKTFIHNWPRAGIGLEKKHTLDYWYPILNTSGDYLTEINVSRFRKVFATAALLKKIAAISNPKELVDNLKSSLKHKKFDTTLTHYLMKTNQGRGIIDSAIVAITTSKIEEGISFKGKLLLNENKNKNKNVFLCECEDPFNPSYDISIAIECKHYDLCLGCERCIITKNHLPLICARILQYEEAKKLDWHSWPMIYEDRWMIAYDALNKYSDKFKDGKRLVEEAWKIARKGNIFLPPIIEGGI